MIKLDILSDPICPWCFIGKTNLDRALERHPEHPFAVEWHPFQLNPEMPAEGMDRRTYLETKFGGKDRAIEVYGQIDEAAKAIGLNINWEGIKTTPNTLNAHRLIHWAGLEQRQTFMVAALFKAYFMDGRDIGDVDTLVEIAGETGLDMDVIRKLFQSDADLDDIRTRDAHARERGVSGVPTFIVANKHAVVGAQPPQLWEQVLTELAEQATDNAP
ncbi:MAG: DsbA family oxidoreductase [Paracoccaceae bacterium]|nr:DsbA family oxidoreductase [Paracoccaceae bacterium]